MKKILAFIASAALITAMFLCGCMSGGRDGRDGKDGQDVSIYEIYEAAKSIDGNENLTFDEFLREYLSYNDSQLNEITGLKTAINRSLMSGVTILTRFSYSSFPARSYNVYTGSGAILWLDKDETAQTSDAYVVTNCHVVYDDSSNERFANDVRLYLYGQDTEGVNFVIDRVGNISGDENFRIPAEVIGASVTYDIALLKITDSSVLYRSDAAAAKFSTAQDVYLGEQVYTIGNASSEGMSASNGIISQDTETISVGLSDVDENDFNEYRVLRTTAPINPGNSGGALYNSKGEIVAIVNAKDEEAEIDNMGYALPANNVRRLLQLMYDSYVADGYKMNSKGGIDKAYLDIQTVVSDSYARFNEQTGIAEIYELVKVYAVNGAPSRGNLLKDDIFKTAKVVTSDGTVKEEISVTRSYHLSELMFSVRVGDKLVLTVERSGETAEVILEFTGSHFNHFA